MNIFRSLIYMARRFKMATALNFIGLTVAFSACYLFLTQVIYNHSYNKCLKDSERLYRVEFRDIFEEGRWEAHTSRMVADELATLPQVEGMALLQCWLSEWRFKNSETDVKFGICNVSNDAISILAPRLIDGRLNWKEGDTKGLIIPASVALNYFGSIRVAGRCMRDLKDSIPVIGVYEDMPENCSLSNCIYRNLGDENKDNVNNWNYTCYIKLKENVDTVGLNATLGKAVTAKIDEKMKALGGQGMSDSDGQSRELKIRLTPVGKTWFSGLDLVLDKGNRTVDWILQLACLLVIIIASINFLNFTLAESPMRIKSVNTCMVLGNSKSVLRMGLVGETVVTSFLAFVFAAVLVYLLSQSPVAHGLLSGDISLGGNILLLLAMAVVSVVVGIVAGMYPAYYVTSFQPALVLKGSFGLTPKGRKLRTALLCLQFVITSVMMVYIGILQQQIHYIFHSDYGFSKDEILQANVWDVIDKSDALRSELMRLTGVKNVSYSQFKLGTGDQYMGWGRGDKDHHVNFTCMPVDWHYLRTMGIEVIEGHDFNENDKDVYIINEAARKQWDWIEMDKPLLENDLPVIGVCKNVRFMSTRVDNNNMPMAFLIMGDAFKGWERNLGTLNVRVAAGIDKIEMRNKIRDILIRFGAPEGTEVKFLDQELELTYNAELRFSSQVLVFSFICMVITLIGVFCMTMFETEYRRKEIGIRKVMGSSTLQILVMLCRRYVWLLLGSFVVAAPLAWYIGNEWLQDFAERTPIYWWIFLVALLRIALVTIGTVVVQSWRVANDNPINSIKNE
ncbi:MAG: FtsX-like permease family protein [Bacteroidaceae bacterium]|nr:FtsX-like permease family protein [Bacteroidaceae bacterium]